VYVVERHPVVLNNLKETSTTLNMVVLNLRIQTVNPCNQFTPIAHVRKAYLV
jgi:hypothetical protein